MAKSEKFLSTIKIQTKLDIDSAVSNAEKLSTILGNIGKGTGKSGQDNKLFNKLQEQLISIRNTYTDIQTKSKKRI